MKNIILLSFKCIHLGIKVGINSKSNKYSEGDVPQSRGDGPPLKKSWRGRVPLRSLGSFAPDSLCQLNSLL